MQPKRWTDVYPQGTAEGNEEQKAFIALARHPEYEWRSVAAVAKESGLSKQRVEEILQKYYKKGMVFQSPKNEDLWGYWERVPDMLKDDGGSITEKDHEERVDDAMQDAVTYTGPSGATNQGINLNGTTNIVGHPGPVGPKGFLGIPGVASPMPASPPIQAPVPFDPNVATPDRWQKTYLDDDALVVYNLRQMRHPISGYKN